VTFGLVLDAALVALLLAAGAGGFFIHRRIDRLVAAQQELQAALAAFDEAAGRADAALKRLEAGGVAKGVELQRGAAQAERLINELSVMNSAGEHIAERIENAVKAVRGLAAARPAKPRRAA
jgi:hypothetical protein